MVLAFLILLIAIRYQKSRSYELTVLSSRGEGLFNHVSVNSA